MDKFARSCLLAYFPSKDKSLKDRWTRLREISGKIPLSPKAQLKLEWMIFYQTVGEKNASKTANYFGISRKTFHKWLKRFQETNLKSLEENSRAPHQKRCLEVSPEEEDQIVELRRRYLKYGKMKLAKLYFKRHQKLISSWKIQRVIEKNHLYPDPAKAAKLRRKKKLSLKKKRIQQLIKQNRFGFLWHTDAIILWWYGAKRVIFTALEEMTKIGYARVYSTNSSKNAQEFLKRLVYLSGNQVENIHHDNGSEFAGLFKKACLKLNINQCYSRARTPQDNAALERFNWSLQDEWLSLSGTGLDNFSEANLDLTNWLIEYNNQRPHQSLDYLTPFEYAEKHKLLPMSPSSTLSCLLIV